jgi:uncharacterized protein
MRLEALDARLAISRLGADDAIPEWSTRGSFFSVTRTSDELSVVCEETLVPADAKTERGWSAIRVAGTLDFGLTGILSSLVAPLAARRISVFAISTFDTDYLLVRDREGALEALRGAGHSVG